MTGICWSQSPSLGITATNAPIITLVFTFYSYLLPQPPITTGTTLAFTYCICSSCFFSPWYFLTFFLVLLPAGIATSITTAIFCSFSTTTYVLLGLGDISSLCLPSCYNHSPQCSYYHWDHFGLPHLFHLFSPGNFPNDIIGWDWHIYYKCHLLLLVNHHYIQLVSQQLCVTLELEIPWNLSSTVLTIFL